MHTPPDRRETPAPPIDREEFVQRMGGDHLLCLDVIQMFLEDCPVRLAAIKAAVDDRNAEGIRTAAHALKGAAGNLSAGPLCDAAGDLERIGADGRLEALSAAWRQLAAEADRVVDALQHFDEGSDGPPACAC